MYRLLLLPPVDFGDKLLTEPSRYTLAPANGRFLLCRGHARSSDARTIALISLLAGRIVHAVGLSRTDEDFRFRVAGMWLTFSVLFLAAIANVILSTSYALAFRSEPWM